MSAAATFPNYTQMRQPLPIRAWHGLRIVAIAGALAMVVTLFVAPDTGLKLWWGYTVPVLPLVFFVAPGLWRNLCPMAGLNQTPRVLGFSHNKTLPPAFKEYGFVVGIAIFFVIVPTRKVVFNDNGAATGTLLAAMLAVAFVGGLVFKGKGGWCSSGVCPLYAVQRLYGQSPFATIPNSHCQQCVGCAKNCYDFNPSIAYLADVNDSDARYAGYRKFFAGAFPGLIAAFYNVSDPPAISEARMYAEFAAYMLVSLGIFDLLERFAKVTPFKLTTVFGAAAFNLYYWYNIPLYVRRVLDEEPDALVWGLRGAIAALTGAWLWRTYQKERLFQQRASAAVAPSGAVSVALGASRAVRRSDRLGAPELTVQPEGKRLVVTAGRSVLDVAEANGLRIEAGCRMGVCGADPIAVLDGAQNLAALDDDERNTLDRLGFASNTRLACKALVHGDCTVALKPERPKAFTSSMLRAAARDPGVNTVVVIGNGIAGVTAADHVRRRHPAAEIHLVAREKHHLYNRMGIERLIYGRSAMGGLYLQDDQWYDDLSITTWLNTRAAAIDREQREVVLGSGEHLRYDRLILATGASSTVPAIEGYGLPGTFVMREADDALALRAYVQAHECRRALVAGGGLLGLEAAHALHRLGLEVSVLERSGALLRRQLDRRGGVLLQEYLEGLGLHIVTNAEAASVRSTGASAGRLAEVELHDGRVLPCDVLLVAAGITPNVELARSAGLEVQRGVVVDDHLRTSDPAIFAVGDVAEHRGTVHGLWPSAAEQAQVAAANALGDDKTYEPQPAATMLKVVGVDLMSVGEIDEQSAGREAIVLEDGVERRYRKLVVADGRLVGAILIGYPLLAPIVTKAVRDGVDVLPAIDALRNGRWEQLATLQARPADAAPASPTPASPTPASPTPASPRPAAREPVPPVAPTTMPAPEPTPPVAPTTMPAPEPTPPVPPTPPGRAGITVVMPVSDPASVTGENVATATIDVRVVAGPDRGRRFSIGAAGAGIGRAPDNVIVLNDPECSRYHARISLRDAEFVVEDAGSANGTFFNHKPLEGAERLTTGDVIGVGASRLVVDAG